MVKCTVCLGWKELADVKHSVDWEYGWVTTLMMGLGKGQASCLLYFLHDQYQVWCLYFSMVKFDVFTLAWSSGLYVLGERNWRMCCTVWMGNDRDDGEGEGQLLVVFLAWLLPCLMSLLQKGQEHFHFLFWMTWWWENGWWWFCDWEGHPGGSLSTWLATHPRA